jgi:hypothetical protein
MEFKEFEKLIKTYQKTLLDFRELSQMGFDFADGKFKLELHCDNMLQIILDLTYTEEGVDWINWFMFENDFGEKDWSGLIYSKDVDGKTITEKKESLPGHGAYDKDGNSICYDIPSLWETVKEYKKY